MANIISVNVVSRTVGDEAVVKNAPFGTKNATNYSPAVTRGFDTNDIISPVRSLAGNSYFTTRELRGMDIDARNFAQITWNCTDTLAGIAAKSPDLVLLTVLFKDEIRQVNMNSEPMVFNVNKMMTGAALVPRPAPAVGTIFEYIEEGNPNPIQYTVAETIAQIAAAVGPVVAFNGHELYVNTIQGNDATAQKGDPLRPWLTVDAAISAAVSGDTVVLLEDVHNAVNNIFKAGVNIELRSNATLNTKSYTAAGNGNQVIYGGGMLNVDNVGGTAGAGILILGSHSGLIKIDVGTLYFYGNYGIRQQSINSAHAEIICDYDNVQTPGTFNSVASTVGNGTFNYYVKIKSLNPGGSPFAMFVIAPSGVSVGQKRFNISINEANYISMSDGILYVTGANRTHHIDFNFNGSYTSSAGPFNNLNAIVGINATTGGQVVFGGNMNIVNGYLFYSTASQTSVYEKSDLFVSHSTTGAVVNMIYMVGGTSNSQYHYWVNKSSGVLSPIVLDGAGGGHDILIFKGGLKATNSGATTKGIIVQNNNDGLIVDGGTIEMFTDGPNEALSASTPHNIRVYGTGFVKGVVSANLTNIVAGSNIIQDANVVLPV